MNFLIDENVDGPIVKQLREDGHRVLYIAEMDPGISDEAVFALANEQNALLITADKDFGELVFRLHQITTGVLLIRLSGLQPLTKATIVSQAIGEHGAKFVGTFAVLSPGTLRIRSRI